MTITFHHSKALRDTLQSQRTKKRLALVPTMGNLHEGHLSLVSLAQQHADMVVVSIFVNPTQFNDNEDLDNYPRSLDEDIAKLTELGVDYIFAPSVEQIYPILPAPTKVCVGDIAEQLCGQSRPHHFDGVAMIVCKLFNIVQPDVAVFGKKDYQQLVIVRQLVRDLSYPIEVIGAETVRADDGLALSSRNQYLSEKERAIAPQLYAELNKLAEQLERGEHYIVGLSPLLKQTMKQLTAVGFEMDYIKVRTPELLVTEKTDKQLVILVAGWLGKARLIDNKEVTVSG